MVNNTTIKNSDNFRNEITKRNLYTTDNQYPINSEGNIDKIVKSISSITSIILPFRANSISDSLLGRVVSEKSKLTEIGLACLSKQISYTIKDNILAKYTPNINFGKGNKFFSFNKDFTISKNTKSSKFNIKEFIKESTGFQSSKKNELSFDVNGDGRKIYTNYDIIDYTGNNTLNLVSTNVSRNKFINNILSKKLNLKLIDDKFSEYGYDNSIDNSNVELIDNLARKDSINNFVIDNLSTTNNIDNFIWGIDNAKINSKSGILSYTRDIIDANKTIYDGIIDEKGRGYVDKDGKISYNGAGIYKAGESSLSPNVEGLRQHSNKDPYGKFARAIRFNGNVSYNGNKNSVIYDSVIPTIHPIYNNNNKNLMFSIENLADTIKEVTTKNGICGEDNEGKLIPYSEIGSFGGRLMWFPPYDISFNETTANKIDETMMVGRGEPIYTYMNSSRSGTLSFKLIIDYPQQLKTMLKKKGGNLTQEEISNFFLYGINIDLNNKLDQNKFNLSREKKKQEILKRSMHFDNLDGLSDNSINVNLKNLDEVSIQNTIFDFLSNYYNDIVNRQYFNININITSLSSRTGIDVNYYINHIKGVINDIYTEITSENYNKDIIVYDYYVSGLVSNNSNDPNYKYGDNDSFDILVNRNDVSNEYRIIVKEDEDLLKEINSYYDNTIEINDFESNMNQLYSEDDGNNSLIDNTFKPAFHSQTPEDFHRRLTFLQQCMRQGSGLNLIDNPKNSIFGKQPFSILRLGDHIFSKVIFSNLTIDYESKEMIWDLNPEGWGMQPMTANITLQMFIIGGQSLEAPVEALQNALSYNYYANSTFGERGYFNNGKPIIKNNTGK